MKVFKQREIILQAIRRVNVHTEQKLRSLTLGIPGVTGNICLLCFLFAITISV